jgi:pectin methylesterase-like acyl-CoA thioesterase
MLAACTMALIVMTGCSGGDDKDSASNTTAPPAATGPTTTVLSTNTSFTGQNSAQFCNLARTYNERFSKVSANPTPAELRTVTREGQTAITQAVNAAPVEIKKDVEVIAAAFNGLLAEMEKVNFEVTRLPPTAFASLSAPEFTQATTRFNSYVRSVCGVTG